MILLGLRPAGLQRVQGALGHLVVASADLIARNRGTKDSSYRPLTYVAGLIRCNESTKKTDACRNASSPLTAALEKIAGLAGVLC